MSRTFDAPNCSSRSAVTNPAEVSAPNKVLLDYFKCAGEFIEIEPSENLSEEQSFFHFGPGTDCFGRCGSKSSGGPPHSPLFDARTAVQIAGGVVRLPFDLAEVVENLRVERYMAASGLSKHQFGPVIRDIYYSLRPWLPVFARKHLQKVYLRGWNQLKFPQWPVDLSVDTLLVSSLALCMKAKGASSVPFIWFWPEGAHSCAMMTHDVETSAGVDFCRELMRVDESFEIKSSFQIVPEDRYAVSEEFLASFRARGFEVNVQDLNHDGTLFREREEFLRKASRINEYLRRFASKGFRSAILYRNPEWMSALEASYDMSIPNVAHLEPQRGGCCTVMPYFIEKMVELPLTTVQDYSLLHILGESSINIWKRQIELIMEKNGLISFIVHPDYLTSEREITLYKFLLTYLCELRANSNVRIALPGEINEWWRARNKMKLIFENGRWQIEGDGSEQARIAYAILKNDRLSYSLQPAC